MLWLTLRAGHAIVLTSASGPVQVDRLEARAAAASLRIEGLGSPLVTVTADRPARVLVECPAGVSIRVLPLSSFRKGAA